MGRKAVLLAHIFMSAAFAECVDFDVHANAPVYPNTCDGDWVVTTSVLYWTAHEDGLSYAIRNNVHVPVVNPDSSEIDELNNLVDDDIENPKAKWEFGYKLGLGYHTVCDGWDINLLWTQFSPKSHKEIETSISENESLVTLWSAFAPAQGEVNFAREIHADWGVALDWVDFELGREYWVSRKLSMRPWIGVRYLKADQELHFAYFGGSWSPRIDPVQDPFTGGVSIDNNYHGTGLRSGLDSNWNISCGWSLNGSLAASILYGRFDVRHKEHVRLAVSPYSKTPVLHTKNSFRASRAMVDFSLGVQYSVLISECRYGFTARLAYEQHLLFHQNQMWRVVLVGDSPTGSTAQNVLTPRTGTLDTSGLTLTLLFTF